MHTDETKNKFIELRAQGWSLLKISESISVPVSTLSDWQAQNRDRIHRLKLLILEDIEQRILGTCTQRVEALCQGLGIVERMLVNRIRTEDLRTSNLRQLTFMAGCLQNQLGKLQPKAPELPPQPPSPSGAVPQTHDNAEPKP